MKDPRRKLLLGRAPGELVMGKYRLIRLLGSGGMGEVYEAEHVVIGRRVAVKFLMPWFAMDEAIVERFQHEARVAGSVESEHIAAGIDFGSTFDGAPFIVMERLVGATLHDLLSKELLAVPRAVGLIIQACRGMAVAHAVGLIHRDLKPANLFVGKHADGTDHLRILDFGIAKLRDAGGESTAEGALLGTIDYMSPEQARGAGEVDGLADVYALGAVLYQALTSHKPHPGDSQLAILHHIQYESVRPVRELRPAVPEALAKIVHHALEPDRAKRLQSVVALGNELLAFVDPRPPAIATTPPRSTPRLVSVAVPLPPSTEPTATASALAIDASAVPGAPARSRLRTRYAGISILLAGALAFTVLAIRVRSPASRPSASVLVDARTAGSAASPVAAPMVGTGDAGPEAGVVASPSVTPGTVADTPKPVQLRARRPAQHRSVPADRSPPPSQPVLSSPLELDQNDPYAAP